MRLTIIPSDGAVYIDGFCISNLTWNGTPDNVHALQWFDTNTGWIEFTDGTVNQDISELPTWAADAQIVWIAEKNNQLALQSQQVIE